MKTKIAASALLMAKEPEDDAIAHEARGETYCPQCHLATPTWRERCIHCFESLHSGDLVEGHILETAVKTRA